MKFGGTSVGDAVCIARVVEIIRAAARESDVVVVVSAMAGVTNKLIEAATQSEAGNLDSVTAVFKALRDQHNDTVGKLIHSSEERDRIVRTMEALFGEAERLCQGTMLLRELTLRTRDAISSLGERLAAPLLAAALAECNVPSEAIEASHLVVTDSYHGSADPQLNATRELCEARLRPLLRHGITPVVTGFIGATSEGVLTTLGRGGSDYSATILGAALAADEIIIWTDVDGLMTADPRLVPGACTVPEISYREASELAYFGAKVLHPKTLKAVMECGIPVWIRSSSTPERYGTRITPKGPSSGGEVKALAAVGDAAMIKLGGPAMAEVTDALGRTFVTAAAVRADVLMISQSSSQNDICLVVSSAVAKRTVEALRREFAHDLAHERSEHITVDSPVAVIAVVGHDVGRMSNVIGRTFGALSQENISVMAVAQGSSDCAISFVVPKKDMKAALVTVHREFQLGAIRSQAFPLPDKNIQPAAWLHRPERPSANAD
jgi:bifunctional aspartokinase / homoserine dehydrogenase 1